MTFPQKESKIQRKKKYMYQPRDENPKVNVSSWKYLKGRFQVITMFKTGSLSLGSNTL